MTLLLLIPLGDGGDGGDAHSRDSSHVDKLLESLEKTSPMSPRHHRCPGWPKRALTDQSEWWRPLGDRPMGWCIGSWRSPRAWRAPS
jgi:hypothetical protein